MLFLMALIVTAICFIPFLGSNKVLGGIGAVVSLLLWWGFFYLDPPNLAQPFWGLGICLTIGLIASAVVAGLASGRKAVWVLIVSPPVVMTLILLGRTLTAWSAFRDEEYSAMAGQIEERAWMDDVQPKDEKDVNRVPPRVALWLADKTLGEAGGAIGSQFNIDRVHATIQMVHGDLYYVVPLEFEGYGTWSAANVAPGFVMISAEDEKRDPVTVFGKKYAYMPSAYLDKNLHRHLWTNGYSGYSFLDFTFEVDEEGHGWWVVTVGEPTIGWSADKVEGIIKVNPEDGQHEFIRLADVPHWIDRVVPAGLADDYLTWRGEYHSGWMNSWWGKLNITEPEAAMFVHGSDDEPYFVMEITSNNANDNSLLGLTYVNARTGKAVNYKTSGGQTTTAVLQKVDAAVKFKNFHGENPTLYNMYGTMAAIVPLLGANDTYQGVAIVNIMTSGDVAWGSTMNEAVTKYKRMLAQETQAAPEMANETATVQGHVSRFTAQSAADGITHFLLIKDVPIAFTATGELSPELSLTQPGDKVSVTYVDSGEAVEPLLSFDNAGITLRVKPETAEVAPQVQKPAVPAVAPVQGVPAPVAN